MSDERKCFAGDLGMGQIGKTVRVRVQQGDGTAEVIDRLVAVEHWRGGDNDARTIVVFANMAPPPALFGVPKGFRVDPGSEVTVLP